MWAARDWTAHVWFTAPQIGGSVGPKSKSILAPGRRGPDGRCRCRGPIRSNSPKLARARQRQIFPGELAQRRLPTHARGQFVCASSASPEGTQSRGRKKIGRPEVDPVLEGQFFLSLPVPGCNSRRMAFGGGWCRNSVAELVDSSGDRKSFAGKDRQTWIPKPMKSGWRVAGVRVLDCYRFLGRPTDAVFHPAGGGGLVSKTCDSEFRRGSWTDDIENRKIICKSIGDRFVLRRTRERPVLMGSEWPAA